MAGSSLYIPIVPAGDPDRHDEGPGRKGRERIEEEDATDDDAILQRVVVVIAPLTGWVPTYSGTCDGGHKAQPSLWASSHTDSKVRTYGEDRMNKTELFAASAAALILACVAGWAVSQARAANPQTDQIDPLQIMTSTKQLPTEHFADYSFV